MQSDKSDKPPKEKKKKSSSGQKKEKSSHKKRSSKEGVSTHLYYGQSQPIQHLIDPNNAPVQLTQGVHLTTSTITQSGSSGGQMFTSQYGPSVVASLRQAVTSSGGHQLFTTTPSVVGSLSQPVAIGNMQPRQVPTTTAVRHHTTLPPKKSLSPSRVAALVEEQRKEQQRIDLASSRSPRMDQSGQGQRMDLKGQGHPWHSFFSAPASQASFQSQDTPSTTSQHLQLPTPGRQTIEATKEDSGKLLRQHLLKREGMPMSTDIPVQDPKIFSPYQHAPSFPTTTADGSRENPSHRGQNIVHQSRIDLHREDHRGQQIPAPNVQLQPFQPRKDQGQDHGQGQFLNIMDSESGAQQFIQRSLDPGSGNIQLQKIMIPRGDTIKTIGSPGKRDLHAVPQASHKEQRLSPLPHQVSTIRRTPSPAHMSQERRSPAPPHVFIADQGERTKPVNLSTHEPQKKHQSRSTGSVVYQPQKPKHRTGKEHHRQEEYTKVREPPPSLHQGEGSISFPSQIISSLHSAGKMQNEILRQTLLALPSQVTTGTTAAAPAQPQPRPGTIRAMEAEATWKFDGDSVKKSVMAATHQASNVETQQRPGRVDRKGHSPHHSHLSPQGGIELKRYSPGPPSAFHATSQSVSGPPVSHQQQIRYTITAPALSPTGTSETSQVLHHTQQQKAPSPKPQHRHKDMSALQHTIQHPPAGGITSVSLPQGVAAVRQPVVSLVRLEDGKHHYQNTGQVHLQHDGQYGGNHPQAQDARQESTISHLPSHRQTVPEQPVTRVPFSQIPPLQQVNPFTFPVKAPPMLTQANLQVYHHHKSDHSQERHDFESKGGTPPPNVSLHQEFRATDRPDEMPRLDPITPYAPYEDSKHKMLPDDDLLEKTAEYITMKNTFNMRISNLANLPATSAYRSTYRAHSVAVHRAKNASIVSAAKSLDLLRQTLQKCINKEIDVILQQYIEKFFKPGIENIKVNNGQNAVSEEHVQAVCRQILEEAKKMYLTDHGRQSITPTRDISDNMSDTGSTGSRRAPMGRKRKTSDTDSEKGHNLVPKRKKGRPPVYQSGRSTPSKLKSNEPVKREGPKWDHERITINSLFIMGARANKALGLGATRGRIYIKHPELFKYSGDQDDKQWLYENHHMPATGGKAYMLLLEDVKELANDEEYRDSSNLLLNELVGFTVTEWMIEKIKTQMIANRTDSSKKPIRSRSTTPSEMPTSVPHDDESERDEHKTLPFSSFSSPKVLNIEKEDLQNSPSGDAEMEFLSGADNDDNTIPGMSPFNITGGFDEGTSRSPSDLDPLDDEAPLSAPFNLTH